MTGSRPTASSATATATCKTRDEDIEESSDSSDNALKHTCYAVDDGHEARADGSEHASDARYDGTHFDIGDSWKL